MKKAVCLTMTVVLMLVLSSCMRALTLLLTDPELVFVDARMEQLLNAIKQQDKDAIKEMFSQKALEEAENIDKSTDDLLSFIQGEIVSWERNQSPMVYTSVEYGYMTKEFSTWFTLYTDEQTYLILFIDYPIDTIDPKNAGLYTLRVLRSEDENKFAETLDVWESPGIYIFDD